jgi:hypothetical protein
MATQVIYKNLVVKDETSWGVSTNTTQRKLQIISTGLNLNPNKELVEDTRTAVQGRDRVVRLRNEIDGDIQMYAAPKELNFAFEQVMGAVGISSAGGSNAANYTYRQDPTGSAYSSTVVLDRNNSQEAFYGIRSSQLSMTASDGLVELTLTTMGKSRGIGASIADTVGGTVKPFVFADVVVSVGPSGNLAPVDVSEWNLDYNNNLERTFLSGSRNAARTDITTPTLEGSFTMFHSGNSYSSPVFGCSELQIRIEATTSSCEGLIAGVTPYYLRIDVPRSEFTTNERNYEQGALSMETINFIGMFDPGTSSLWLPQLFAGLDLKSA